MHEVRVRTAEGLDERLGRLEGEADEVDDGVGVQVGDAASEDAVAVLLLAVGDDAFDLLPLGSVRVGGAGPAGHDDDVVAGADEAGDEEGADVAGGSDDDDAHARHARPRSLGAGGTSGAGDGLEARGGPATRIP